MGRCHPGQPEKSMLFKRITLPADHKKFMPAEGKPPLKPEEIVWIKAWIQQGASPALKVPYRHRHARRGSASAAGS